VLDQRELALFCHTGSKPEAIRCAPSIWEVSMPKSWSEPKVDDLLNDPILDGVLRRDRLTRDDVLRVITEARCNLARVPRQWHVAADPEG